MTYSKDDIGAASAAVVDASLGITSTAMAFVQPLLTIMLIVSLVTGAFAAPAMAASGDANQADGNTDFLCDGGDTENSSFVTTIKSLLTVMMVGGPVVGTAVAAFATVAASAKTASDDASKYIEARKKSLFAGWSVPILVYALDIMSGAVLGIDISCIIP